MAASNLSLTTDTLRVLLNEHGDALSLHSNCLGLDFTKLERGEGPLFSWFVRFRGETKPSKDWSVENIAPADQILQYRGLCSGVELQIRVSIDTYGCGWQVNLTNKGGEIVDSLDFELQGPFSIGSNLYCTYPFCAGWALPISSLVSGDLFSIHYPVQASMQWVSLYTTEQGVYFGVHDDMPYYKTLILGQVENVPFIRWQFSDMALLPGQETSLPTVYLALHNHSWRGGARIYHSWASRHMIPPRVPVWFEKNPSWAWVGLKGQLAERPWHRLSYLPKFSKRVAKTGVESIQLTAYTEHGHDTLYPDYFPGPSMGGEVALRAAVKTIHRNGKRISIYVNGRCVDPASSLEAQKRYDWSVSTQPGGPPYTERYGKVTFDVMCPGAKEWKQHILEKMVTLVKSFDIDGFYIDQVCGCTSLPCYTPGHEHQNPNQAWSFYKQFLAELRSELLAIKPDLFLATEGVNDIFGQFFDAQQAHNDWASPLVDKGIPLNDLFRFTFPGYLLNEGCITGADRDVCYLSAAHLFGGGCDFGVWNWSDLAESFTEKVQVVLDWHRRFSFTLRMGHVTPIECNRNDFQANVFSSQDALVICGVNIRNWNISQPDGKVTYCVPIPVGRKVLDVHFMGDKSAGPWREDGDRVRIEAPAAELFGAMIELFKDQPTDKIHNP